MGKRQLPFIPAYIASCAVFGLLNLMWLDILVKILTISMPWYNKERLEVDVPATEFSQPILA